MRHDLRVEQRQHGIVEIGAIKAPTQTWRAVRTGCKAQMHEHHGATVDLREMLKPATSQLAGFFMRGIGIPERDELALEATQIYRVDVG